MKNKYLVTIYKGLSEKKTYKDIHKELYKMTINSKVYSERLYKSALQTLKTTRKKLNKEIPTVDLRSLVVFQLLNGLKANQRMEQEIYKDVTDIESKAKTDILEGMYEENRAKSQPIIFYLASDHTDSAEDHKDYQGKMYVDANWQTYITNKFERAVIRNYIKQKNIKTIQWVTGRPVWFVTRPNCRHYFKGIPTKSVIGHSVEKLIIKNDMHREVGRRLYIQTLRHSTSKKWYENIENAQSLLNKYKERLKYHITLNEAVPNDLLKKAIKKDKMLINKWSEYLQTRK